MAVKVYFTDVHTRKYDDSKIAKVGRLCDAVGLSGIVGKDALTAVKLHFGELGNDTYLRPPFVRMVVDKIKEAGGKPFLTDTNTLYSGSRRNAVDHLQTAYAHGFSPAVVSAPVIVADGLYGQNTALVPVNLTHYKEVHIAQEIFTAQSMVVLSHFKGHQMTGFGGAIKNLGMGCASVPGKRAQHNDKVSVREADCIACGECVKICPEHAIQLKKNASGVLKAAVKQEKCIGCFECVTVCEPQAIAPEDVRDLRVFVERVAEYAYGAIRNKQNKLCFINFVLDVTPDCDCASWSDASLVPDIGILASADPVALDKACFDLVTRAASLMPMPGRASGENVDKFTARWKDTCGLQQITHGEAIGLGSADYDLVKI